MFAQGGSNLCKFALTRTYNKTKPNQIRSFGWFREIRDEWRENDKASQPMENPPNIVEHVPLYKLLRQPLSIHWKIFKEVIVLYKLTWTNQDEAVRQVKTGEEILKQMKDERAGITASNDENTNAMHTKLTAIETDMKVMTDKLFKLFPKNSIDIPKDSESAKKFMNERQDDAKHLAVDRLEVMGVSLSEFMKGYREGKEEGIDYIHSEEGEKYFASFDGLNDDLEAQAQAKAEAQVEEEEEEEVETKAEGKAEGKGTKTPT